MEKNAFGQITRFATGNGVQSVRSYYPATGRLNCIYSEKNHNILQNLGYYYDDFGNLAARIDKMRHLEETFTYLSGPLGVFAVVEKENGAESLHYILKDHLGSWTTITDGSGNVVREQSFDAWGNMRNPETWSGTITQLPMFDRGFTGHEHVQYFGIINMNGRMYDPVMSSFLSVDNYVQAPDFSQSFNRYAYCLNNPLKYTDPSGEIHILVAVGISAAVNVIMNGISNVRYDENFFYGAGQAAVVGGLQGLFSFGIGESAGVLAKAVTDATKSVAWGMAAQVGFQLVAHGTLGGMATMWRGGRFCHGFVSGATASVISGSVGLACVKFRVPEGWAKTAMIAGGALSGGLSAEMAGGDFIDGFCNGLICAGLNHALHWVADGGGKLLYKQYLRGIENFEHFTQLEALFSSRNNVFGNRQTLCKYACLEMIEKFFFGSNGRGQWGLSRLGVDENQKMLPFYQALGKGMDYSVFSIDDPSQIAESLASGDPLVLTEWDNSGNGHSVVVVGVAAYEGDVYQLLYYDPLSTKGQFSMRYWSEVSESFSMCRFGKYNQ